MKTQAKLSAHVWGLGQQPRDPEPPHRWRRSVLLQGNRCFLIVESSSPSNDTVLQVNGAIFSNEGELDVKETIIYRIRMGRSIFLPNTVVIIGSGRPASNNIYGQRIVTEPMMPWVNGKAFFRFEHAKQVHTDRRHQDAPYQWHISSMTISAL